MLMNKILRYSFVALLAMMFAPSFAEDIIWQEDFSSYAADAVPAGGDSAASEGFFRGAR